MYFLSYFYRVSPAIVAPELMAAFDLEVYQLGLLSSVYFYTFASAQFAIGPMLDRLGPRLVMSIFCTFMTFGAFLFAASNSFPVSLGGRALIGLGSSVAYMGTLKILANWFRPNEFAMMAAIAMALGNIGAMTAATPLALLVGWCGWRKGFMFIGILTALLSTIIFGAVRDHPAASSNETKKEDSWSRPTSGIHHVYWMVFKSRDFWIISLLCFSWFGSFIGVQGLWAGPYLMNVHGFSSEVAGNVLAMIAVGFICGAPLLGRVSDQIRSRKPVIFWGLLGYTGIFFALAMITDSIHIWMLYFLFFCFGFFGSTGIISYAQLKELFPMKMSGTVLASVNFFAMIGAALFQQVMGLIIQFFIRGAQDYNQEGYSAMFLVGAVAMAMTLMFYRMTRDTHAKHLNDEGVKTDFR
jgi:sugar phosphate permease